MTLLHATWISTNWHPSNLGQSELFLWADQWRVVTPKQIIQTPSPHPFSLSSDELKEWLNSKKLLPNESINTSACLTLPSKPIHKKNNQKSKNQKTGIESEWKGLPLQAHEEIATQYECWPWKVDGISLTTVEATEWLTKLPLSKKDSDLSEELLWWAHLERWSLNLIASGLWLPQVKLHKKEGNEYRASWIPLLNQENERNRLEEFAKNIPLVAICAVPWIEAKGQIVNTEQVSNSNNNTLSLYRPRHNRVEVMDLLEELIDAQLRKDFQPRTKNLDPLLKAWQEALGTKDGIINLSNENAKRLEKASKNWKRGLSSNVQPAKTCLELIAPIDDLDLWDLNFSLQSESDPSIRLAADQIWEAGVEVTKVGGITIDNPSEILLEGLGRSLEIFPPIEKGLESPTPHTMKLSASEAFVLIRTAAAKLRDMGIGVILPNSLSKGFASRLGLAIQAELPESSLGVMLGESLNWDWELMIGGINLSMKELEMLAKKNSPLLNHKGTWIELRPNDLKNASKFFANTPELNLDKALRLSANKGNTFMKLPVHHFESGPRLQSVLEQYHHQKAPEPLPAPNGFHGQLRPYQERGLGWLAFLYRFKQGACLADDMGLGKTIQLLCFIQHLKVQNELTKPVLLIAPTSVLTNWKREAATFTPELCIHEHYGSKRHSSIPKLQNYLKKVDIMITSYGLLYRDGELLQEIDWQGIVIDEAQAIKNSKSKQSIITRAISKNLISNPFRIALTGTPVENRISELWALMDFLNPKVLGEEDFFNQRYKLPIEHYGDISSLKDLKTQVSPFILRRLKTDQSIISDLPQKIELNEWVGLSQEQELLYKQTVEKSLDELASLPIGQRQGKTLGLLTRLKQICNHPAIALKETQVEKNFLLRSSKLQRLEEILQEVKESHDRALLFTQFAEWGHLLQAYLQTKWESEVPFLHGGTPKGKRQEMIDRFQDDPRGPNIFLLSLKAGGVGLNLTRANHVFHIDRWWNPAVENQATDRAYRIGQKKSVIVHKFITTGTIEEKINQMILEKTELAENIVGSGESWLGQLSLEKLSELVALDSNPEF
ncbi:MULTISPECIES: DEAD/DEAH box helicase [Prochlorococcus]|uniref:Superfamily II DNA/RNA helicases, SNF2 family n=1 Tax=Prochlorococcus marinus (strain SARG / CCMP1375 / SS120) TaxID=167539 RepID=Q7VEG6_PROMA|nr:MULTISPECIES: DEAD/DEAH box helicase [Prochlorococcus]AAP99093.1 Superfamily II DNA/RNA helicases, SNF2 family [Prochlorococcus marinus subsp. marinus str. CCMP1375]KGG11649.1 Helicase [Prochlorococcus marinus str. LG]KGG22343.1 Helicase [Prochlorococcus marinus str. SS2]KGG22678.1 Helicase [Prochlorococcus marinus str. SS35]KGG32900.1 Helicase [Prochlorococcus marinus str. SS51]